MFFDDCWNPNYKAGKQPEPKPGVHNSGWVRDPGDLLYASDTLLPVLEAYVKDVLSDFKDDHRIILWDLYNEPGNSGYGNKSMPLLKSVFGWEREINPSLASAEISKSLGQSIETDQFSQFASIPGLSELQYRQVCIVSA